MKKMTKFEDFKENQKASISDVKMANIFGGKVGGTQHSESDPTNEDPFCSDNNVYTYDDNNHLISLKKTFSDGTYIPMYPY
jgi:hypothetical protein